VSESDILGPNDKLSDIMNLVSFLQFLWASKNLFKNHNNLMNYFDVILLSDVIWTFGPKVTRRVTYVYLNYKANSPTQGLQSKVFKID